MVAALPEPAADRVAWLMGVAAASGGVFTVAEARAAGFTGSQIRTRVRRGSWRLVKRGLLAVVAGSSEREHHLEACHALALTAGHDVVVSHSSAAVVHGLPYVDVPSLPQLTVPRADVALHLPVFATSRLPSDHCTVVAGLPVTNVARTVADVLRIERSEWHRQALADGALRHGADYAEVAAVLAWQRRFPGVIGARGAWNRASALSESPLESRCSVWFRDGGLPEPEQQVTITDQGGIFVARVDFFFRAQLTVVEADGRVKYQPAPGEALEQTGAVLWDEKRREDRLRDLGFEVVRATWSDGSDGGAALVARVRRAFERSARHAA